MIMALYAKRHFESNGHTIKSSPYFAPMIESNFWKEVVSINKLENDDVISFLLSLKRIILILSTLVIIGLIFVLHDQINGSEFS